MTDLENLIELATARGTDKQFLDWITRQPSCIDGSWSEYHDSGPRNMPCHVRRAGEAGTAFKPKYSAIPMTFDQHNEQSWHGEAACLNRFRPKPGMWSNAEAKQWFDEQRIAYLTRWLSS